LEEALAVAASEPETVDIRSGRDARLIASLPLDGGFRTRHGASYRVIHRRELVDVLAAAVAASDDIALHLDTPLHEFAAHANGITVLGEHNKEAVEFRGSALVGADGIRSHIRSIMPTAHSAQPSGRT